ncbi:Uncharacterized protein GBIM_13151 [Gryllus bimaculatus]|nr:Uncharacterized protein GBIM_13151 [Gryllus bimaculatus]
MDQTRQVTARSKDCLECRLVGGIGMMGIGLYVGYNGYLKTGFSRSGMICIACGAIGLGMARILDFPEVEKINDTVKKS